MRPHAGPAAAQLRQVPLHSVLRLGGRRPTVTQWVQICLPERLLGDARRVGGGAYVGWRKWVSDGNSNTALGDNSNSNTRVDLGFSAQELSDGARISSIR